MQKPTGANDVLGRKPKGSGGEAGLYAPEIPLAPGEWMQLLERQVGLYTGADSASVPVETAQELLRSVLFCLQNAPRRGGVPFGRENAAAQAQGPDAALGEEAEFFVPEGLGRAGLWLRKGQRALERRRQEGEALLAAVVQRPTPCPNAAYKETIAALESFFVWYDIRFFAHQIPCMITYPLAQAVPDALLGVHYINEYLCRLRSENCFCRCFAPLAASALLHRARPGWQGLPHNLFQPVFVQALGRQLLGRQPRALLMDTEMQTRLVNILAPLRQAGGRLEEKLGNVTAGLCDRLRLWQPEVRAYTLRCAKDLAVYLAAADDHGLQNLFCAQPARE